MSYVFLSEKLESKNKHLGILLQYKLVTAPAKVFSIEVILFPLFGG